MAEQQHFDLIVIGGGPAGYVGAIRAAQLGQSVACVERDRLGGVCLNWGCIPTKALLAGAEFYERLTRQREEWGVMADNVRHDWSKVIGRSRGVATNLNKGVQSLFKKHKIKHFEGHAFIPAPGKVRVFASDDPKHQGDVQDELTADHILIATGAEPRALPGTPFDGDRVIASKQAMTLEEQPKKLLIVGSGAIGMEFAYFYNAFGTEVTIVEMLDRLLPVEDRDVSKAMLKSINKRGIKVLTEHVVKAVEHTDTGIKATIEKVNADTDEAHPAKKSYGAEGPERDKSSVDGGGENKTIEADKVLVAIGVKGRYDGLFDESLGLETVKDHLKTDYRDEKPTYATNVKGIYAVGDVIGPPWLAHVASEEAILCVEQIFGHDVSGSRIDYDSIPGCTYCQPQVASIGYTEQRCEDEGIEYTAATFPLLASGKAQALGHTEGFAKMIVGKAHGEILGCHLMGENVTELIAEISLAKRLEATADEVIATIHAHPTMSEAIHEAALGTAGRMIHY